MANTRLHQLVLTAIRGLQTIALTGPTPQLGTNQNILVKDEHRDSPSHPTSG